MSRNDRDYVLGTSDDEIARLALQHRVWRSRVLECWERAGLRPGMRVVDLGCGPGFATIDLAGVAGRRGSVLGIERSSRYLEHARAMAAQQGLDEVTFREADLVEELLEYEAHDFAWCRWVASFVTSREALVANVARSLAPGGIVAFHEYVDYRSWRVAPDRPAFDEFVDAVMSSWRAAGGEPDAARELPSLLVGAGFELRDVRPQILAVRPGDHGWQWPAAFVANNVARLVELGRVDAEWGRRVHADFDAAQGDPSSVMLTPMVLEIVALKL